MTNSLISVSLRKGDVLVLARNIWHDACHGMGTPAAYYYLASRGASPATWVDVTGEKLTVTY